MKISTGMDESQRRLADLLSLSARSAAPFDKHNLNDLSKILKQDIACRAHLKSLEVYISRVEISEDLYSDFLNNLKEIVSRISACAMAPPSMNAILTVNSVINGEQRPDPNDIFAIVSIIINTVAECLTGLELSDQRSVVQKLDRLLAVKETQLSLIEQTARFYRDSTPPDGDGSLPFWRGRF